MQTCPEYNILNENNIKNVNKNQILVHMFNRKFTSVAITFLIKKSILMGANVYTITLFHLLNLPDGHTKIKLMM